MDGEHDGTDDEKAIGDIEVGPGQIAIAEEDPVADTGSMDIEHTGLGPEAESIVEVTEDTGQDGSHREGEPARGETTEAEHPDEDTDGGQDREDGEEPAFALSDACQGTLVDGGFDAEETANDPPRFRFRTWQALPFEDPILGGDIGDGTDDSQGEEDTGMEPRELRLVGYFRFRSCLRI